MPHFIKTGYWEKASKAPKGYLNLDQFTDKQDAYDISHMGFKPGSVGPKVSFKKDNYADPYNSRDILIPDVLEIARGDNSGLYNAALQTGWNSPGPTNTQWSSIYVDPEYSSWGPLENVESRTFTSNWVNSTYQPPLQVGAYMVIKETTTGRIWLIKFTEWTAGGFGGGFAYDRWEIYLSVSFQRPNYEDGVVDKISDGVHIARYNYGGQIYNTVGEQPPSWEAQFPISGQSPINTRWNSEYTDSRNKYSGFDDMSNLERRVYTDFTNALDYNVGANILSTDLIMHDLTTDLYYKVVFSQWTSGGNGGGFAYTRTVIPQSLPVRFGDGSVMTSAVSGTKNIFQEGTGTKSVVRIDSCNTASNDYSSVLGGYGNLSSGNCSVVVNGVYNSASGSYSSILNGYYNTASNYHSTVVNGLYNIVSGTTSFVMNGGTNTVSGAGSAVLSGNINVVSGCGATVFGNQNTISGNYGFTGGTGNNDDGLYNYILANQSCSLFGVGAANIYNFIAGGFYNRTSDSKFNVILGGCNNATYSSCYSSLLGGACNQVNGASQHSTVLGGFKNQVQSCYGAVLGGFCNFASHNYSVVMGCCITSSLECALHVNRIVAKSLPTSAAGLPSGAMWRDAAAGNVVKIVP